MINSQKTLEFDKIKKLLADACPTSGAAERAYKLSPYFDRDDVIRRQSETSAAKDLSLVKGMPSFFHVEDISSICDAADKSATLSPADLLTVASHLKCAQSLVEYIRENKQFDTVLDEVFERLQTNRRLEERISRSIISVDLIADDASPALADIRRALKRAASNVRESLQKYTSGNYSKYLQENIVTMRGGRFVIPVKAEYRNEIRGLLHDTSASGATLFIEPESVVEANNAIRELESREKFEIDRILAELSANVSAFSGELRRNYRNITDLAFAFGCGELSCRMNAVSPRISEGKELSLLQARHPLLDPKTTVPVTIELGDEFRMMVITGPNTGGKTVSLKTTGLFPMMAQAGLHIPCREGSVVPVFDNIFADIGDEQSIEQSLSTFSAHMAGIVSI
ncbi:MAG: endonuclease MutS2, partial [Clostridia bacterium]|nr:endonuclease MutS2 [Clostridia bacterium]